MKTLITIAVISFLALILMLVSKTYSYDERYAWYTGFRDKADGWLTDALLRAYAYRRQISIASAHFFKKSVPLFFAHLSSIIARYMLQKSSSVVDMVKGRHVIDHAGTVSPFLGKVSEYREDSIS